MMSTQPIRHFRLVCMMLFALCLPHASQATTDLTVDEELRAAPTAMSAPASAAESTPADAGLNLTPSRHLRSMPPAPSASPVQTAPDHPVAATPAAGQIPAFFFSKTRLLRSALTVCWLLTAALLCLHLLREWARVMRVRVRRPDRSIALEHAQWPTVAILLPLNGSNSTASALLVEALPTHNFDYPAERIHFIPLFDPANRRVTQAVARLAQACPDRVQALPMMSGRNTTLAAALHAANACSIGTALVVYEQEGLPPQDWLRQSVTPLLDPAIGAVLTRVVPRQPEGFVQARLNLLADHADTLIATQADALSLLLCGKARIRALRRQAVKSLQTPDLAQAPDGASIVQALTHMGWQSHLLGEVLVCGEHALPDLILSPRMRFSVAWRSIRMASILLNPRVTSGCRKQVRAAFFSAALPLLWLLSLMSCAALYFAGSPLLAAAGIALCAATSFDPHGQPGPAFGIAAAARMAGLRSEIQLLPLTCFSFIDRLLAGLLTLLHAHLEPPALLPSRAAQPVMPAGTAGGPQS
jgi:hypothetical protein